MTWRHNSYNVTSRHDNVLSQTPTATCIVAPLKWAATWDFQQCDMYDQQRLRSACAYTQSDQSLFKSLEFSMSVMLLTEHHFEFPSLKGDCTGQSVWVDPQGASVCDVFLFFCHFPMRCSGSGVILIVIIVNKWFNEFHPWMCTVLAGSYIQGMWW